MKEISEKNEVFRYIVQYVLRFCVENEIWLHFENKRCVKRYFSCLLYLIASYKDEDGNDLLDIFDNFVWTRWGIAEQDVECSGEFDIIEEDEFVRSIVEKFCCEHINIFRLSYYEFVLLCQKQCLYKLYDKYIKINSIMSSVKISTKEIRSSEFYYE